jgi:heme/copper-type cytochrome/quinol oxidase subunit 2
MLALFFAAYILVTILAAATTEIYGAVSKLAPAAPGISPVKAPVFLATVPYHVLIMLIVWTLFALIYFKKDKSRNAAEERSETRNLAFAWLALAIIVDFVGFVLIKHPYSLSAHAFYVDYQPWISLIYLAIFLSPWIRLMLVKRAKR